MEKSNLPYDTISRLSVSSQSLFNKCCCCIPLRTGCFILGYLNVIVNIFQFLFLFAVTTFIGVESHGFDHFDKENQELDPFKHEALDDEKPLLVGLGFFLIIVLIVDLIWVIINIACLVGLHKKNPGPIRVYVGCATFRLTVALIGLIYQISTGSIDAGSFIISCVDLGLTAYFVFVYYIYAGQLEREQNEQHRQSVQVNGYVYPAQMDKKYLVA